MIQIASGVFQNSAPDYVEKLLVIARFLIANPDLAPKPLAGDKFGSKSYWERITGKFVGGRNPKDPQEPKTVPDHMVSIILQEYFGLEISSMRKVQKEHSLSMAAENIVGDLLERYLASRLEIYEWVWCSGEVVKKVDFLQTQKGEISEWVPLQVKNRDNSENSSSSSVRDGTGIVKWFRTFSRNGKTNWENFPGSANNVTLSEKDFEEFTREYLRKIKP